MNKEMHPAFSRTIIFLDVIQRIYMRLLTLFSPVKDCHTVFGSVVRCSSRDFLQRRIRFFQIFEHNLTFYTMRNLRKGDVYVDIGANIGYYSLLASRCVGETGRVISIEADPITFAALKHNLNRNVCLNVEARNIAATAKRCKVRIQPVQIHNSGSNSIEVGVDDGNIEGLPFGEIVGSDLSRVRFIKIDIEGSEGPVLNEILDLAAHLPSDLIIASEVSPASADFISRFVAAGFRVYAIQNVYTIDYYLIRSYLNKFDEDRCIHMVPVSDYDPNYTDYIFERTSSLSYNS